VPLTKQTLEPGRPLRVIVADDDRDAVITLAILFRSEGIDVRIVESGDEVPEAVREFQPDVVLLDIVMPGRGGYDLAQELNATYGEACPVLVAVTAHTGRENKLLAEISGFNHYVAKPYDPVALLELMASIRPRDGEV
jgi:CheY-like chemotaxis protein